MDDAEHGVFATRSPARPNPIGFSIVRLNKVEGFRLFVQGVDNIDDKTLEENHIMLPVISMNLKYHKPTRYDELLTIKASFSEIPTTRFSFQFEFRNEQQELICSADTTTAFVNSTSRKPMKAPPIIIEAIEKQLKQQ